MEVEKNWKELMILMTEEENGRLRPSEEKIMLDMPVDDFFMSLTIFKERMNKRIAELNKKKNATG